MRKKQFFAAVLSAALLMTAFTACTDKGAENTASKGAANLRILWWGTQARHDSTIKVLDMYEEKNDGVKFEPEFMGYSGYYEKIATLAAANNWPDIMQFDVLGISPYVKSGRLYDLSDLIKEKTIDTTDVSENVVESGRIDGGIYAVSLGTNAPAIAYNKEILKKAGVDEIPLDWTWDDMEKIFEKIKDNADVYPADTFNNYGQFSYYLRLKGKSLYSKDGKSLGYSDDALFADYFGRYVNYIKKGYILPPEELLSGTSEESPFALGKTAFQANWSNSMASLEKTTGIDIGILPLPDEGGVKAMYTQPTMFFALAADTKYPKQAAQFLNYFINDIEANKVLNAERGVPVSEKVREALLPTLDSSQKKVFEYIDYLSENSTVADPIPPSCSNEIDSLLSEFDEQIRFGKTDAKKAAKEFRKQAESILARSK